MPRPYLRFGATLLASLLAMFVISLEQVRSVDHFYLNASNFYISLTGVGAMGLIMFAAMRGMFKDARMNVVTVGVLATILVGGFVLARTETFVGDKGFLESMIPHHSRAVLVCQESDLTDPEIIELCGNIVESQTREINQMKQILERY
ncbi:MAG: DUF305 domain-containing protein [Chloroflexi bacterium]|nr:DUF305 domain-containing protein [Chloroflexota bacterium]